MRRRHRHAFCLVALGPAAVLACTGADPVLPGGPQGNGDAAASSQEEDVAVAPAMTDGAAADAGDGDGGATVVLLRDGDFEATSCGAWRSFQATKRAGRPRSGAQGCLVCYQAAGSVFIYGVAQTVNVVDLVPGQTYTATVHAHRPDAPVTTASDLRLEVRLTDRDGQGVPGASTGEDFLGTPPLVDWSAMALDYTYQPADGGVFLELDIINRKGEEGCFVVDDATLVPQNQ